MADIRVIVYYVPRSPVATSYTLYFSQTPPSGPLPLQPDTPPPFIGKFTDVTFQRIALDHQRRGPGSGPLPPQPETNLYFIAKPWPVSIRVLPALRHNYPFDPPPTDTLGMFIVRVRQDEWRW